MYLLLQWCYYKNKKVVSIDTGKRELHFLVDNI